MFISKLYGVYKSSFFFSESLAKQKQNQQETKPKPSQIKPKLLYHRFISEKITAISSFPFNLKGKSGAHALNHCIIPLSLAH
jgi:hypothetical protein